MYLNRIIILIFTISLLSSNILWAGDGQLDDLFDSTSHYHLDINLDDNSHSKDDHRADHDCHMSAHLIGLNSPIIAIADFNAEQIISVFDIRFSTRDLPPPSKPPRT